MCLGVAMDALVAIDVAANEPEGVAGVIRPISSPVRVVMARIARAQAQY